LNICKFKDKNTINGDWGLGIGDWGLGIGDWAQYPIPKNPKPQTQTPNFFLNQFDFNKKLK